jgi:pSer/pThr/pTyr-binding forkhead associated (FHA) protein
MSGMHFVVECDENGCTLRDPGSSNGTSINGRRYVSSCAKQSKRWMNISLNESLVVKLRELSTLCWQQTMPLT